MRLNISVVCFAVLVSLNSWGFEAKELLQLEDRVEVHRKNENIKFYSCHLSACTIIGKKIGYTEAELRKLAAVYTIKQDMGAQLIWDGIEAESFVVASSFLKPITYEGAKCSSLRCGDNKGILEFLEKAVKSKKSADYIYPMENHRAEICAAILETVPDVVKQLRVHLEGK